MNKKILITGATGLIGPPICEQLISRGDEVTIFTRSLKDNTLLPPQVKQIEWNYLKPDQWGQYLEEKDAIIHLAGINLFSHRWTERFKAKVIESRKVSTFNLSNVINHLKNKPEVFISASAIGYYGNTGNSEADESYPAGSDFLAEVCKEWEMNAAYVESSGVRRISVRTGVVLDPNEGALKEMLWPFRLFIGGPLGSGKQWFSWIHLNDVVKGYIFAVDNKNLSGPVNLTSPNPVRMNEFAETLGKVLRRPSFFKVPSFALKIIAGEAADVVTYSQRIIPAKLSQAGFTFEYPQLYKALKDLLVKTPSR
jgi:uncharacterized protein (TIGR01777 family)